MRMLVDSGNRLLRFARNDNWGFSSLEVTNSQILERYFEELEIEIGFGKDMQARAEINLMLCTIYSVVESLRKSPNEENIIVGREFWAVGTGLISMFLRHEKTSPTLNRLLTGNYKNPQKMLEELNKQKVLDQNIDLWQMLRWLTEWKNIGH